MAISSLRGSFADSHVLIIGLARQGWEAVRFFTSQEAFVTACDRAAVSTEPIAEIGKKERLRLCLGPHHVGLLQGQQLLCISAGVSPELPIVQAAVEAQIPVVNDTLLTFARSNARKVVVTGSQGKTTTTTLAGAMLEAGGKAGKKVWVGGNMGAPLLRQAEAMRSEEFLLWEGSSFQLEMFDCSSNPMVGESLVDAAALLNLTPNHLDRHSGMAAYAAAKLRVLYALRDKGLMILNQDDPAGQRLLGSATPETLCMPECSACEELLQKGRDRLIQKGISLVPVSIEKGLSFGASLQNGLLLWDGLPIVTAAELQLRGQHNVTNALAACALAGSFGASHETMGHVLREFTGVPHRLEEIANSSGTVWINDSIATSPERAIAGMRSCFNPQASLIVLAGGYDKGLPWATFAEAARGLAKYLILFGQAGPAIAEVVTANSRAGMLQDIEFCVVPDLEKAVQMAAQKAKPNSTVLLSPGGASFDGYSDFEARGQHFRELVHEICRD